MQHGVKAPFFFPEQQLAAETLTHILTTYVLDLTMLLLGAIAALRIFPAVLDSTISNQGFIFTGQIMRKRAGLQQGG